MKQKTNRHGIDGVITSGLIAILLGAVLALMASSAVYMHRCARSQLADGTAQYTGYGQEHYVDRDFRQWSGWYVRMDNGQWYYIHNRNPEYPLFHGDAVDFSKEISIVYFSSSNPLYRGKIISLKNGGETLLTGQGALQYATEQWKITVICSCVTAVLFLVFLLGTGIGTAELVRRRKRKAAHSMEVEQKMERLRAEGLLHPGKQRRKSEKND